MELWFDGAGSEGRSYDWPRIMSMVRECQPDAMIFNMGAPTIRWVGNEDGLASYPCWNAASEAKLSMYTKDMAAWLPETPDWVPAECDVPIRKKTWFWHPDDEKSILSRDELMDIYYRSVGHGANLLLNLSPDNQGLLPDADRQRVLEFGAEIRRRFKAPLAEGDAGSGYEFHIPLQQQAPVNHVILMEQLEHGERIREYVVEACVDGVWMEAARGSAVGRKKIDAFSTVTASAFRLRILEADETPMMRKITLYHVSFPNRVSHEAKAVSCIHCQ